MHIDWFVFFAQIVNFLILLFLLKKFLYGRIINAMDAREAKIAAIFAEAEECRQKAREKPRGEQCRWNRHDSEEFTNNLADVAIRDPAEGPGGDRHDPDPMVRNPLSGEGECLSRAPQADGDGGLRHCPTGLERPGR